MIHSVNKVTLLFAGELAIHDTKSNLHFSDNKLGMTGTTYSSVPYHPLSNGGQSCMHTWDRGMPGSTFLGTLYSPKQPHKRIQSCTHNPNILYEYRFSQDETFANFKPCTKI
jgi:hypothetical protein